jgi:hypothetical protein
MVRGLAPRLVLGPRYSAKVRARDGGAHIRSLRPVYMLFLVPSPCPQARHLFDISVKGE